MSVLQRVVRRETHSPRTVAMVVAVVILALALIYLGVEIVLALASQPALAIAPVDALGRIAEVPFLEPAGAVIAAGVVVALIGLVFIVLAIKPGRLPKHRMELGDRAFVIDNGVVAASLAQRVSDEAGIPREHITVGVAHRVVDVAVTPDLGAPLDASRLRLIVEQELGEYHLTPPMKTVVRVARSSEPEMPR